MYLVWSQIPVGDTWDYFATGERIIPTFKWYLVPGREYLSGAFFGSCEHFCALPSGTKHRPPSSKLGGCHFGGSNPASQSCIEDHHEDSRTQSDAAGSFSHPTLRPKYASPRQHQVHLKALSGLARYAWQQLMKQINSNNEMDEKCFFELLTVALTFCIRGFSHGPV